MGWSYEDWRGSFYPAALPAAKMLATYATLFDTVELDTTFYGVPRPATLAGWAAQVPPTFLFSAKVPRAVSHERRLVGAVESALEFGTLLRQQLGTRLGALLLQLPPDFASDDRATLDAWVDGVCSPRHAPDLPWVVEFRHASWADTDIAGALQTRNIACATTERLDVGGALSYVRLLGQENAVSRFDARVVDRGDEIAGWADRIATVRAESRAERVLVYVRNFFEGHAPATVLALRERLGLPTFLPPGKQQMSLF